MWHLPQLPHSALVHMPALFAASQPKARPILLVPIFPQETPLRDTNRNENIKGKFSTVNQNQDTIEIKKKEHLLHRLKINKTQAQQII